MKTPEIPENEAARQAALDSYLILDTPREDAFDALTRLAAHIAAAPIALVSLVDRGRQWFKSRYGLEAPQTPRDVSFCAHVVATDAPLVVENAETDPRFAGTPLVTGEPRIVFYAGIPLTTREGFALGSLCVVDHVPRTLSAAQLAMLELLARQVVDQLELRRQTLRLQTHRNFFELSLSLLCTATTDFRFDTLNPAFERVLGWSLDELRGRLFTDFVHPDDLDRTVAEANRMLERDLNAVNFRNRYRHKNGSWVWLSWTASVRGGTFYAVASDLSEYVEKEDALSSALQRLQALIEGADDGIITKTIDGVIESWNPGAEKLFGYAADEAIGQSISLLFPSDRIDEEPQIVERLLAGETVDHFDTVRLRKDGRPIDVSVTISPLRDRAGAVVAASKIVRDITKQKQLEGLKSEFVSTVSHELRTPLTSIRGALGLVSAGVMGELPGEAREYVDIALSNSERLVRLINDILDIEKIRSGEIDFRIVPLLLDQLIEEGTAANEPYASAHGVRLARTRPPVGLEVLADRDRLLQVLTNLLSNAVKFSPPGQQVEISTIRTGHNVRVQVRDHGEGVPEEFRPRIFQRFAQADASATRSRDGTGLGLHISRAIIQRLGGRIDFEDAEGGGTRFFFELPLLNPVGARGTTSRPSEMVAPRVLHVEDDQDLARIVRRTLPESWRIDSASSLKEAHAALQEKQYEIILLDLDLPDGRGEELIGHVGDAQVVIFSAQDTSAKLGQRVSAALVKSRAQPVSIRDTVNALLSERGTTPD